MDRKKKILIVLAVFVVVIFAVSAVSCAVHSEPSQGTGIEFDVDHKKSKKTVTPSSSSRK